MAQILRRKKFKKMNCNSLRIEVLNRTSGIARKFSTAIIGKVSTGRHTLLHSFRCLSDPNIEVGAIIDRRDLQLLLVNLTSNPSFNVRAAQLQVHIFSLLDNQDSAGVRHFEEVIRRHVFCTLKNFILIYDITSTQSFKELEDILQEINYIVEPRTCNFIVVGNKKDKEWERQISPDDGADLTSKCGARNFYECSALNNLNTQPVLDSVLHMGLHRRSSRRIRVN
ncbi:hypothetical protein AVEN_115590-1 [Araneus ventricosus]|uniref:small monomeric GTPase n=1 Tax=Araneus ventricosus TaxID=182803 RepID=A0A4Y2SXB5_ARAVE|nr:hypothetical protein AVEN_115590-1 [Araneus ventricosus]